MKPRTAFILRALGFSLPLFVAWWFATAGPAQVRWIVADAGFVIPVLAIILASRLTRREKILAIGSLVVLFVEMDIVFSLLGVRGVAETGQATTNTAMGYSVAAIYHALRIGLPIGTLIVVSKGNPQTLWAPVGEERAVSDRCPYCGRRRAGLEMHIRDAHGQKALQRAFDRGEV